MDSLSKETHWAPIREQADEENGVSCLIRASFRGVRRGRQVYLEGACHRDLFILDVANRRYDILRKLEQEAGEGFY